MMLTIGALAALLAIAAIVQVVTIWITAQLVRVKNVTFGRAVGTYGVQILVYVTAGLLAISTYFLPASTFPLAAWLLVIFVVASVVIWVAIARYMLRSGWWQAIGVYVAQSVAYVGTALLLRFVVEGFLMPTNSMAPTIVGHRYLGTCPDCGGRVIVTALESRSFAGTQPDDGICDRCWKYQSADPDLSRRYSGDRILASKVEQPRRWDVVVYTPPSAPNQKYAHRLVGLPGEQVSIRDGGLWIDGHRLMPPQGLDKLRYGYDPDLPFDSPNESGRWQLGDNEYFVLGDNTEGSMDSRYSGPITESALHGVAIAIYWPPNRMRLLRPEH